VQAQDEPKGKDSSSKDQHDVADVDDNDEGSTICHGEPASGTENNNRPQVTEGSTSSFGTTTPGSTSGTNNNTATLSGFASNGGIGIAHHSSSIFPHMAGPPPPSFDMMRRGSMNSAAGFMDDSFFRRPSLGFDMNAMDNFFSSNRRDSMDSSTAVLDAAIMDLSRRRFSTMGAMNMISEPVPPPSFALGGSVTSQHESISQRQQQLKQQQRELEQRQRDLAF
jgi:hypothetical protein